MYFALYIINKNKHISNFHKEEDEAMINLVYNLIKFEGLRPEIDRIELYKMKNLKLKSVERLIKYLNVGNMSSFYEKCKEYSFEEFKRSEYWIAAKLHLEEKHDRYN